MVFFSGLSSVANVFLFCSRSARRSVSSGKRYCLYIFGVVWMMCADTSAMVVPSFSVSCIDQPKGRLYVTNGLIIGYLLMSILIISTPALCVHWILSCVSGICFLALVVHDDAANLCIFCGRSMLSFVLDCSIRGLSCS